MSMIGSNLMLHMIKNMKSAIVSNLEPNSLVVFVLLAIQPSTISVSPADIYNTTKAGVSTAQNNNAMLHKIRMLVIVLAN